MALVAVALFAFLPGSCRCSSWASSALGAGTQMVYVVQVPYIAEHTEPGERNEYFAIWSALGNVTALVAALLGGAIATEIAARLSLTSASAPYQVLLTGVAVMGVLSLATVYLLTNDRPASTMHPSASRGRFGIAISDRRLVFKLLLPGFITALGAGQLIPFLNVFVKGKFGLDLADVNAVFAVTSLGTTLAILAAAGAGSGVSGAIGSIVLVQGSSIPFLLVLGFLTGSVGFFRSSWPYGSETR